MKGKILNYVRGLYYYYSSGASFRIPYFSTIAALTFLVFLHFIQISIALKRFFSVSIDIFPIPDNIHRGFKYVILGLYFVPIYLLLTKVFPESRLRENDLSNDELRKYRYGYFIYLGLNVLLIVLLISDKIIFKK